MKKILTTMLALTLVFALASITYAGNCGGSSHGHKENGTSTSTSAEKQANIVETAMANESFSTLVAAVKAAGLVDVLSGDGPFTVFAPTDEAFAKLPEGTLESLLADKDKLTSVLTYHVISANVKAADVVKLAEAKTVNGQKVAIKVTENGVAVDNANVVMTDIACSNGTIHVIDSVILPNMEG